MDEIQYGPGSVGQLVGQSFDLSSFLDIEIQIRIYQHTRIKNNAFFSLFDDLCLGWTEELEDVEALVFGEAFDWGF
jgi:hypothetical protein